jgi:hypothetical protein
MRPKCNVGLGIVVPGGKDELMSADQMYCNPGWNAYEC